MPRFAALVLLARTKGIVFVLNAWSRVVGVVQGEKKNVAKGSQDKRALHSAMCRLCVGDV